MPASTSAPPQRYITPPLARLVSAMRICPLPSRAWCAGPASPMRASDPAKRERAREQTVERGRNGTLPFLRASARVRFPTRRADDLSR
eukprot:2049065-Pyramimonas_sp.AAC.1